MWGAGFLFALSLSFIHVCYFISFIIFKSSKGEEPVALTTWSDPLFSPNYPFTYPANSTLTWIKSVSTGNIIEITIDDLRTQCDGDYLEIRDGDSMASPLIARYCGSSGSGKVIRSSGTHMILHFVSDNVTRGSDRGFTLRHTGVCKVHTNATSGVITTPNYPNNYLFHMDCLWTIQLHPSILITLECDEFALEYREGCIFDYVEILAGVSLGSPVLGRFCGVYNNSLTFERDGNMSIRFVSDKDKESGGFRCVYSAHQGFSSPLMTATARNFLTLTRETILSSAKENSQEINSYTIHSLATIHSNLLGKYNSSPTTFQNGVRTTSLGDATRSTNQTTFSLAAGMAIPYSSDVILQPTDGQNTGIRIQTTDGFNTTRVQTLSLLRSTVSVSSIRDGTFSSLKGTGNSPRNSPSNEMYSSPTPNTLFGTQVPVPGSVESHQRHTGSISAMFVTVTRATTVCCETSNARWSGALESGMHQTHEESTLQTEFLSVRTVQQTSDFHVSLDRIGGFEADGTELASNLQRQSPLSTSEVTSTFSGLSSTISPSNAAPSHPPGDSATPALNFPWHLIPFLVILFVVIVVLFTYYLRIPGIIDTIILAIKQRRKHMKALKPGKSFTTAKRNFSIAGFEASTFHSYQRELFYDATLNYAMFEQSKTKAIEFSVHFDETQQFSGPEESVEISCVMEEEPAKQKQGHGSLGEMFDTSGSDVVRSSPERTINLHDSPVCYDI